MVILEERNEGGRNITYIAIETGDHKISVVVAEGEDTFSLGQSTDEAIETFRLPIALATELAEVLRAVAKATEDHGSQA